MKNINFNQMENFNGGVRCAFDFSNTSPVCQGLFTAFAATAAGFNNLNGAFAVCGIAGDLGCTVVLPLKVIQAQAGRGAVPA